METSCPQSSVPNLRVKSRHRPSDPDALVHTHRDIFHFFHFIFVYFSAGVFNHKSNWIVVVSDLDVDWTITNFDGEKFYLSTCGKRLYVWKRSSWLFYPVTEWTEKEKEDAEEGLTRLVEAAAARGGGTGAVRDFLKQAMERYDIKVHYLRVASTTKPWMEEPHTYCCLARVHSPHGYMVAVFMPNQKIVI